jgi:hypothetical protein
MFTSAAREFASEVKALKRQGHGNFRVVLGSMNRNLQSERNLASGACVNLGYEEFEAAAKAKSFHGLVKKAKSVFHALNDGPMAWKLKILEDRKCSGGLRLWQTHQQDDGRPFAYAFSKTAEAVIVLLARADSKSMPGTRFVYAVSPSFDVGLLGVPDALAARDVSEIDISRAIEALDRKRLLAAADGLPIQVVEAVYEHSAKFDLVRMDAEGRKLVVGNDEREAILKAMTISLDKLDLDPLRPTAVDDPETSNPGPMS